LNPPYSSDLVRKFIGKLCQHVRNGDIDEAIVLVNNATETKWWQEAKGLASAICFPQGWIKFLDEDGRPGAPLQGQVVLYFGKRVKDFIVQFGKLGGCVCPAMTL
jgi:hypothetical protein